MVNIILILLFLGLALLVAEAAMPGFGVCGISGLILVMISAVITIITVPFGVYIVIGELFLLAFAGFMFFRYIKRKQLYGKIILNETLEFDEMPDGDLRFYIGKEGVTKTPLRPVGNADFNGTMIEVYSNGDFIDENKKIKVIDVNNRKVIVCEIENVLN